MDTSLDENDSVLHEVLQLPASLESRERFKSRRTLDSFSDSLKEEVREYAEI